MDGHHVGEVLEITSSDLRRVGVGRGDTLLVMSDVRFMRLPKGVDGERPANYAEELLEGLLHATGPSGTIVGMAFTEVAWTPVQRMSLKVFDREVPPKTGALIEILVRHPEAVRSRHPTNSFVALGPRAEELSVSILPSHFLFGRSNVWSIVEPRC